MMNMISTAIMPLMITAIILHGLFKKVDVFPSFLEGAKGGLETAISILPSMVGLFTAIAMLRASGFFDLFAQSVAPLLSLVNFPEEILPLAIMRPISGSGGMAIVSDILSTHGPDSTIGRIASVLMGSTETTIYTIAIYYGSVGIKKTRHTLQSALLADLTGIIMSVVIVNMMFL
ncbi:MAG: nucleoside recognition domain-containing protein [Eubacteriales bacterium]|nr:nucleoside recognition domain-containing protein [Eubacteriales bacterium]